MTLGTYTLKEVKVILGILTILVSTEITFKGRWRLSCNIENESPLNRLPYANDAPFNSYSKQHEPTCLPDTRVDLLKEIYNWADGQDERCIFWLNGLAGTGKSTIARTIARKYYEQERLGASFFFSRGSGDIGTARKFATSIALQLASRSPLLEKYICESVRQQKDIANQSLADQWRQLVLLPLSRLHSTDCRSLYLLVVDALDECDSDSDIRVIVQLLAEARSLEMVRLRVVLTSRPEIPIRYGFRHLPNNEHQAFVLHDISPSIIDHDISIFLEHNFRIICHEYCLDASWPGAGVIETLVRGASGLFIWAATACRFIDQGKRFAAKRLTTILNSSSIVSIMSKEHPEKHLNNIYITVLEHSISPDYMDEEKEELFSMLRHVLGSIVVLLSPLSTHSLSRLLDTPKNEVDQTLEDLHSILDIPTNQTQPLRLHHPSFRDFLLDRERYGDSNFWVDAKQTHQKLAQCCIRLMSDSLKQDICNTSSPSALVVDIESTRVEQCLPPEVQYACLYWIQHLQQSSTQLYDNDYVHQFLKLHLLHWLEALSWMERTSEGILAIFALESLASVSLIFNSYKNLSNCF
jgi:hypothetical protein